MGDRGISPPEYDPAFEGVGGRKPGLHKWVIQQSKAVHVAKSSNKIFFSGDCYILLKSAATKDGSLSHEIHYWLGKEITQDEAAIAAVKALELDFVLGGLTALYREAQGNESEKFLSYFKPCIVPQPGRFGIKNSEANQLGHVVHLYLCEVKNVVHVKEVPLVQSFLKKENNFILDAQSRIFLYNGRGSSVLQKAKVLEVVQYIKNNFHGGKCDMEVIDDLAGADEFWTLFGGFSSLPNNAPFEDSGTDSQLLLKLYCFMNGKFAPVDEPLVRDMLDNNKCYLLDCGIEAYLWIGRNTSLEEKKNASKATEILLGDLSRTKLPVTRVIDGSETLIFKSSYDEWLSAKTVASKDRASSHVAIDPKIGDMKISAQHGDKKLSNNSQVNQATEKGVDDLESNLYSDEYASASDSELPDVDYELPQFSEKDGSSHLIAKSVTRLSDAVQEHDSISLTSMMKKHDIVDIADSELTKWKTRIEDLEARLSSSLEELQKIMADELENIKRRSEELATTVASSTAKLMDDQHWAAVEAKKVLEFDKKLEVAFSDMKKMENQISNAREDLKNLRGEVAYIHGEKDNIENKVSEYGMSAAALEEKVSLVTFNVGKLTSEFSNWSKSEQMLVQKNLDVEQKITSMINEKLANMESVKSNFKKQTTEMEALQARVDGQEVHILSLKEELSKLKQEKNMLKRALLHMMTGNSKRETGNQSNERYIFLPMLTSQEDIPTSRGNELGVPLSTSDSISSSNNSEKETEAALKYAENEKIYLLRWLDTENRYIDALQRIQQIEVQSRNKDEELALARLLIGAGDGKIKDMVSLLQSSRNTVQQSGQEINECSEKKVEHLDHSQSMNFQKLELGDSSKTSQTPVWDSMKVSKLEEGLQAAKSHTKELEQKPGISLNTHTGAEIELQGFPVISRSLQELATKLHLGDQREIIQPNDTKLNRQEQVNPNVQADLFIKKDKQKAILSAGSELQAQETCKMYSQSATDLTLDTDDRIIKYTTLPETSLMERTEFMERAGEQMVYMAELNNNSITEPWALVQSSTKPQDVFHALALDKENSKLQLTEIRKKMVSVEKRGFHLAQQLEQAEFELFSTRGVIERLEKRLSDVTIQLNDKASEVFELRHCLHAYEDRILQLNSSLRSSRHRMTQLEEKVESLTERYLEQRSQNHSLCQLNSKLEELLQSRKYFSKDEGADSKVTKLERQLEPASSHMYELQNVSSIHSEPNSAQPEAALHSGGLGNNIGKIESSCEQEVPLNYEGRVSRDTLKRVIAENKMLKEQLEESKQNFVEAEKAIETLQDKLDYLTDSFNLDSEDFKNTSGEKQVLGEGTLSPTVSSPADAEHKLHEAPKKYTSKDLEVQSLHEQIAFYRDQVVAESEEAAIMKREIDAYSLRCATLGNELEGAKMEVHKLSAENESLTIINETLREQLNCQVKMVEKLQQMVNISLLGKEEAAQNYSEKENCGSYLSESFLMKIQSAADARFQDCEIQLKETIAKLGQRDAEIKELKERLEILEIELGCYEEDFTESSSADQTKFDEIGTNLWSLGESHQTHNMVEILQIGTDRDLETYQPSVSDLQLILKAVTEEKDDACRQLHSLSKAMHEMTQQKDGLQSKVFGLMEENRILHEECESIKKDLEDSIDKLEEQVKQNSANESQLSKLQRQYTLTEKRHREEIQILQRVTTEKDDALNSKFIETESMLIEKNDLQEQILEVRKELEHAYGSMECQDVPPETSMKKFTSELQLQHQRVVDLEKLVDDLKVQLAESEKRHNKRVLEDAKKLVAINLELDNLRDKISSIEEWEEKILGLEEKLEQLLLGSALPSNNGNADKLIVKPINQTRTLHLAYTLIAGAAVMSIAGGIAFRKRLRHFDTLLWLSRLGPYIRALPYIRGALPYIRG